MANRHTPGPWKYDGDGCVIINDDDPDDGGDGRGYANVIGHNREANAQLIAVAPEILECLQEVKAFTQRAGMEPLISHMAKAYENRIDGLLRRVSDGP